MQTIDMHCDTLMLGVIQHKTDIMEMPGSVDFKRMKEGGVMAQFFASFLVPEGMWSYVHMDPMSDEDYIAACKKILDDSIAAHSDIVAHAYNGADIRKNFADGKLSAVFTIEDGRAVQGKMENIKKFYDMGVRAMTLTWNFENCFGAPNSKDPVIMNKGLTDFGKEAIVYMQELGMLVDVSHLSDGGFYDVANICKKPFVATHSNARALCPHQRNLKDDMIRLLGNAGGVTGLNFGPEFLNEDITCKDSTAKLMAKHARHIANLGGVECVGVGSDFDGIEGNLEISSPAKMELLADALKAEGFTAAEVDKIANGNVLRVMDEATK